MKKIDENTINEIKQQNDIVDVISNYVSLIKKGKNYQCLCPFHDDSNPSMVISQEKQIYKCFSCGAGGNVITFVQNYEKISFAQALVKLAQKAGIALEIEDRKESENNTKFQEYYQLNEEATNLFKYLLSENNDSYLQSYLDKRGIDNEIADKFKIGYSPSNDVLTNLFKSKGYDLNKAVELGLLNLKDNEYRDNYAQRLIYPIINHRHQVVGFSARALKSVEPKYLNSIESKVFNKSHILYNLNNAQDEIRKEKKVYLAEGPNDVIAFDKAGFSNVVCVMGTAFSQEHITLLKNFGANQIILAFDGDDAGKKATYSAISKLLKNKVNIKYIDFEKYDPDEYLNLYGFQKFKDLITKPLSALEFKINYEYSLIDSHNYSEKKDFVLRNVQELSKTLDEFDKEYFFNYLANLSGLSLQIINSYAQKQTEIKPVYRKVDSVIKKSKNGNELDNASINILYFIMNDRKYFDIYNQEIGSFINPKYRRLANVIAAYYLKNDAFDISSLDTLNIDEDIIDELMKILLSYDFEDYNNEIIFNDSIETMKYEDLYLKREELNKEMLMIEDPLKKVDISTEILEISRTISAIKEKKFNK